MGSYNLLRALVAKISGKFRPNPESDIFLKNIFLMITGSGAGKLIAILSIPLITRIYSPNDMGILALFSACVAIAMPVATLRYNVAIPLPKRDEIAMNLALLCLFLIVCFFIFLSLFFYFYSEPIFSLFGLESLHDYWWLVVLAVAFGCLYETISGWAIRMKAFKELAKSSVWQSVTGSIVKITLGLMGLKPAGLLIGQVFSVGGGVFSLLSLFIEKLRLHFHKVSIRTIFLCLKFYSDLPKYRLPSQFLLAFSMSSPVMFVAWLFGIEMSGQLGLAIMALSIPLNIVGNSVGQVYYAEIAKLGTKKAEEVYATSVKVIKHLLLIAIAPFFLLLVCGPWLFELIFGEAWRQAGVFSQILSFCLLAQFISTPLVNALNVFGAQKTFLKLNFVRASGVVGVFGVCWLVEFSPIEAIAIYSAALFFHYLFTIREIFRVVKFSVGKLI